MSCDGHGPRPGDIMGTRCKRCGHVDIAHDDRGCAVCALWDLVDGATA